MNSRFASVISALIGCALTAGPAAAQGSDFYAKNGIKIIVGAESGGSYDLASRLIARHLGRFIPGNPNIIAQAMPGAGGLVAANHLSTIAPKDGSVLGVLIPGIMFSQLFNEENVRFDAAKFQWIGNPLGSAIVTSVYHTAPVKTWQDVRTTTTIMGATGSAGPDAMIPRIANATLGTKFKLVLGYKGGSDIALAMARGEVHGRGSQTWAGWKATHSDWIRDGKLVVLWQLGLRPLADLPNVPQFADLIPDAEDKTLVKVYTQVNALGRPMMTPPDVPADRVEILRRAFDAMVVDPAFVVDAEKTGIELGPIPGREIQSLVAGFTTLDSHSRTKLQALIRDPGAP
jgi:tripartite-type tricarboxylate transporter receptor subunit TctC